MAKRIIELTKGEYGFSETHSTLAPIEKRHQREGDAFPQFMDINVKQLLDSAKARGGWVMLINETPTTYSSQRVHACPECGWPMRRQGRGATAKKNGYRYVCARAEAMRDAGLADAKHAYVRAWTHEELEPEAEPKHPHIDGAFASLRGLAYTECPCGCGSKEVCETQRAKVKAHNDALSF